MQAPARRPPNLRPKKSLCFSSGPKAGKNWWPSSRPLGRRSMGWYFLVFALFRSSSNWMRPTHIRDGNLLYSVYCLNVHLTQKHPQRHTQNNVTKCLGILWPRSFDKKKKLTITVMQVFFKSQRKCFLLGSLHSKTTLGAPAVHTAPCSFPVRTLWHTTSSCWLACPSLPLSLHLNVTWSERPSLNHISEIASYPVTL